MSPIKRRPRPLTRETGRLRDDRLFIVACDDTYAPKQYFDFFRIPRVQVHVVPTIDGTSAAPHVLGRLLDFDHDDDDERWLLLDTDHCTRDNHFGTFVAALADARRRGIQVALSKPSFELWLLLHHREEADVGALANAGEVERALRTTLGRYDKRRLDAAHYPLASVAVACGRSERLDGTIPGGDNPEGNTSRVHLLWKAIVASALPSQLPVELRVLQP